MRAAVVFVWMVLALAGCEEKAEPVRQPWDPPPRTNPRPDLRWKRARTVERDLARALELTEAELCNELGDYRCLRSELATRASDWRVPDTQGFDGWFDLIAPGGLHLVALGGNDPFFSNQHEPLAGPIVTTIAALDRVAAHACGRRADLDIVGPALIYVDLDFDSMPSATDPGVVAAVEALIARVLGRRADRTDIEALASIADGGTPARDVAVGLCHAVVTSIEFVYQ